MVGGKITQSSSKTGKGSWRLIDLYLIKIEQRLGLYIFKYLKSSMLLTHIVHWDQYLVAEMDFVVDDMFLYMNPRVTCYSLTLYNLKSIVAGTSKNTDIYIDIIIGSDKNLNVNTNWDAAGVLSKWSLIWEPSLAFHWQWQRGGIGAVPVSMQFCVFFLSFWFFEISTIQ